MRIETGLPLKNIRQPSLRSELGFSYSPLPFDKSANARSARNRASEEAPNFAADGVEQAIPVGRSRQQRGMHDTF
jgi:hypothetical protein